MPKVGARSKGPLQVKSGAPWSRRITHATIGGGSVLVRSYQEARDYAAKHGYSGIKITYV